MLPGPSPCPQLLDILCARPWLTQDYRAIQLRGVISKGLVRSLIIFSISTLTGVMAPQKHSTLWGFKSQVPASHRKPALVISQLLTPLASASPMSCQLFSQLCINKCHTIESWLPRECLKVRDICLMQADVMSGISLTNRPLMRSL